MTNIILILVISIITLLSILEEVRKYKGDKISYSIFDADRKKTLFVISIILCTSMIALESLRVLVYTIILALYLIMSNILCLMSYRVSKNLKHIRTIVIINIIVIAMIIIALLYV